MSPLYLVDIVAEDRGSTVLLRAQTFRGAAWLRGTARLLRAAQRLCTPAQAAELVDRAQEDGLCVHVQAAGSKEER